MKRDYSVRGIGGRHLIHTNDFNHLAPWAPDDFMIVVTYGYPRSYVRCWRACEILIIARRYTNVIMSSIYQRSGVGDDKIHFNEIQWLVKQFNDNCMLFSYRRVTR